MDIHPPWQRPSVVYHSQRLAHSFHHWTGGQLVPAAEATAMAHQMFVAPFVLLSHGLEADPILNYGNQAALDLWQTDWEQLTRMPSRLTAEPTERQARAQQLTQATAAGCIENYRGIRITRTGRRFLIENATIWDVLDEAGDRCGQAAKFSDWMWLESD
ncbi:MEKHLA domain-containing protein [Acaryochloris thomasi]|nr:MEKHLA domain-containing protein [Acaryochloris thomasi]